MEIQQIISIHVRNTRLVFRQLCDYAYSPLMVSDKVDSYRLRGALTRISSLDFSSIQYG